MSQTTQLEDRQTAGLLLKNNVTRSWSSTAPAQQSYIKACLLGTLSSPHRSLRAATGTAVSVIAAASSLPAWPELVVGLTAALDSHQPDAVDGALDALEKICEEARHLPPRISPYLPVSPRISPYLSVCLPLEREPRHHTSFPVDAIHQRKVLETQQRSGSPC